MLTSKNKGYQCFKLRLLYSLFSNDWQDSSVVEQRIHKPWVESSILSPATITDN